MTEDSERPDPDSPLAPAARMLWRLELLAGTAGGAVAAFFLGRLLADQSDDAVLDALGRAAPWLIVVGGLVSAVVLPSWRYKRWRWRLDDQELDLRHGTITDVRTIVPVARIQHVDIERSAVAQIVGVAAVVVHTAAGETKIPALEDADAAIVRDRIAGLIRTPDDE